LKSEESSVQSSPMESFGLHTFLCKCVVSNFVLHVYLCHHCSSLAPYIKSTGSQQQQQQSVYSLILHSRVTVWLSSSISRLGCEHCEKYRSLLGWQLHSWDLNALFRCLYFFQFLLLHVNRILFSGNAPSDISSIPREAPVFWISSTRRNVPLIPSEI